MPSSTDRAHPVPSKPSFGGNAVKTMNGREAGFEFVQSLHQLTVCRYGRIVVLGGIVSGLSHIPHDPTRSTGRR